MYVNLSSLDDEFYLAVVVRVSLYYLKCIYRIYLKNSDALTSKHNSYTKRCFYYLLMWLKMLNEWQPVLLKPVCWNTWENIVS